MKKYFKTFLRLKIKYISFYQGEHEQKIKHNKIFTCGGKWK
jgi:hypothetical protein